MADNAQKTPLARSLNDWAARKIRNAIQVAGKSLPCHVIAVTNSIVTVSFDVASIFTLPNITCPIFGPEYTRAPTQIGDKGVVFPVDFYIGGVTGLGGGTANLSGPANLSTLVFFPVGNKNWTPTDDPNAYVIYGPDGFIARTTDKTNVVTVSTSGITLKSNVSVTIEAPNLIVNANVQTTGTLTNNGVNVGSTHEHTEVTTGGDNTGPPV